MATLSKASPYEMKFKTRHRPVGRPSGETSSSGSAGGLYALPENLSDVHPLIARVARRRAEAVVHDETRERKREVFLAELKVLNRRGVAQVAEDVGVALSDADESSED